MKAGNTFASLFAMIARRHMHDFGTKKEHLAAVAVKNHANGANCSVSSLIPLQRSSGSLVRWMLILSL